MSTDQKQFFLAISFSFAKQTFETVSTDRHSKSIDNDVQFDGVLHRRIVLLVKYKTVLT